MWIIRVVGTGPILIAFVTCGSRLGARSTPCQPEAVVFDSIHPCYKNIDIQHGTAVAAAVGVDLPRTTSANSRVLLAKPEIGSTGRGSNVHARRAAGVRRT